MDDEPPIPPTALHPYQCANHMLAECTGEMFLGTEMQVCLGPSEEGPCNVHVSNAVLDIISKGVVHYTNLPAGGSSPRRKCKTAESSLES